MCTQEKALAIAGSLSLFAKEYLGEKLYAVIVYGSYARADFNSESDIDICILVDCPPAELEKDERPFSLIASRLSLENDITVSVTLRDAATFNKYKSVLPFYGNIEREGIRIA